MKQRRYHPRFPLSESTMLVFNVWLYLCCPPSAIPLHIGLADWAGWSMSTRAQIASECSQDHDRPMEIVTKQCFESSGALQDRCDGFSPFSRRFLRGDFCLPWGRCGVSANLDIYGGAPRIFDARQTTFVAMLGHFVTRTTDWPHRRASSLSCDGHQA